ncbi:hypothetical protein IFM89_021465 [Coptis chinensis]|uniref:RING-type domain-containing protein n=1 Tax=Coptis chinensis TaxID=261450 RepID=A0A835IPJ2_9MAGN|nr:hypothetical protein IFM89_021465 [Coptis chinensis]
MIEILCIAFRIVITTTPNYLTAVVYLSSNKIATSFLGVELGIGESDLINKANERLRATLQEQRKQQQLVLLKRLESKTQNLLRQKDEELAKASRKTMELEDCIRKVDMENQAWQRVAKENESMAIALSNTLEQVKENASCLAIGIGSAEDAESCCCEPSYRVSKVAAMEERNKMTCKVCNSRNSCILFLPCRHLCSCKSCESLLDSCPVCKSVKKACIDVYMS